MMMKMDYSAFALRGFCCGPRQTLVGSVIHPFPITMNGFSWMMRAPIGGGGGWSSRKTLTHLARNKRARAGAPDHQSDGLGYHSLEDINDADAPAVDGDARLTDAEITRTIIEVNSKATLLFSGLVDDEVQENIICPELPYLTDEHGDIYFELNDEENVLQVLVADDKVVQVLIGLDNVEMLNEMEMSGSSEADFTIDEISNEESDDDDEDDEEGDSDEDWVSILEDDEDDFDSSEVLTDWATFETMHSSHPMYFAKRMTEAISDTHLDWMVQPSNGLVIQSVLRPAFNEENSVVRKNLLDHQAGIDETVEIQKDESRGTGATFYKLEMINIQLSTVKIQDFRRAKPDVIAHSAVQIISRFRAGGERNTQALKSLCWRLKGIQVEEAVLTGVDSLGIDLRVCSGTQVQTLRLLLNIALSDNFMIFCSQGRKRKFQRGHKHTKKNADEE
ncbi:hypothetical protein QJS04_geneDACA010056 [Acorus gramineus]|uniref:Uncharacterized protein n=1 Tax=Acorus gramineus TaxID=55184 RepID=A0AAV9BJI9_ACOGR|nr:hypothetical protein QJS04_geneDACA010056 [Acorus gramineus]